MYTYARPVVTLHGDRIIRVKVLGCKIHTDYKISLEESIDSPLLPKCRADLNVTILIGILWWRLGMKRTEIWSYLQRKGIHISEGTISYRSLDFLLLFKQMHESRKNQINAFFDRKGFSVLHIDGTYRTGRRVVFVLQEGIDNMIIDANLIPSEASKNIEPILKKFKETYGSPLVIVRDMGRGVALSASNVFPGVPQQICHPHFIRELERELVTIRHKGLRSSIVKHKLTSRLRGLRNVETEDISMTKLQQQWIHIAVDYLLYPIEKQLKWMSKPIAYYLHYLRIIEVSCLVRRLVIWNASRNYLYKPLMELDTYLRAVLEDENILHCHHLLDKTLQWLDELREQLKISRDGNLKDHPSNEIDIDTVKENIKEILQRIRKEGRQLGCEYKDIASAINEAFDNHWDELFVPNPIVNGKAVKFRRHNNGLEGSHRNTRKSIRERTGRSETNREMEQYGDLLAILSNLWNETYQKEILYDVIDLADELGKFVNDLPRLRREYREVRRGPEVPIADDKRMGILDNFVNALECVESNDDLLSVLQSILSTEVELEAVYDI